MAKTDTPKFPTTGGSYARKPDGKVDQVEATAPPPAVQEHEAAKPAAPPTQAATPAATPKAPKE